MARMPVCWRFARERALRGESWRGSETVSRVWWRTDAKSEAGLEFGKDLRPEESDREIWPMCSMAGAAGTAVGAIERQLRVCCAQCWS